MKDVPFVLTTMARRGLLRPGGPLKVKRQLGALRTWGYGLAGELRSAASRDPRKVAVVDDRGQYTYEQLLDRSTRLARSLAGTFGVMPGERVGLLCRNHAGIIEGLVAAAMLGADPVLINTGLSGPQLGIVAEEQRLRVLIHDTEFAELVVAVPRGVERLDESRVDELIAVAPAEGELRPPPRDSRTIVLTSGTTGSPKGARRRTPSDFGPLMAIISRIPLRAGDRVCIAAPIFHTWGYAALQMCFGLRATMVLQRRFDPGPTLQAIHAYECTALFAVPVMLQRLLDVPPTPTPLRVVAVSGSALPGGLATRFMDAYGDILYNLYGSTEASWVSIATPADLRRAPTTAGRPPRRTRVAIVDRNGRPVPRGEVGRLFVGNDMLFEGYTSGAGRETLDGLLDTGDLGHLNANGLLFVDGRQDDMIISGGENVFPSEVEELLAGLPQVREVAVVGVPDREYGQRLAAYLVLHPGEWLDSEAVREYVRRYRARFCVPRYVVFLTALPRNATGKVVPRLLPPVVPAQR